MWTKIRNSAWWDDMVLNSWNDADWKENCRVNRSTFYTICDRLRPVLESKKFVRKPFFVEKRLAVTLARLTTSGELRNLANLYGMARFTVCVVIQQTCSVIIITFSEEIKFLTGDELYFVTEAFLGNHGLPGVCGALDGTHIPIKAPPGNSRDYFNRKQFYCVILQAIVDHKKKFTVVNFVWPGSVHDARVLKNADIFRVCENKLLTGYKCILPQTNTFISLYFVADPAYLLKDWIMKPFTGAITYSQNKFNVKLSSCRIYVEHAFGMLKGRWRCLFKANDSSLKNGEQGVLTCCILHNIAQDIQDEYLYEWDEHDGISYADNSIYKIFSNTNSVDLQNELVDWCK